MTEMIMISEMIEETRPIMKKFLCEDLGYSEEQGDIFVDGYMGHVNTLPMLEKMAALEFLHDDCMKAGLDAAGIDEEEALERFHEMLEADDE